MHDGSRFKLPRLVAPVLTVISRHKLLLLFGLLLAALAPVPIAAVTNSEVIAIYVESIKGLLALTKLAYCASGVAALC